MRTCSTGLSSEKVQLCKMCVLVLRDILHLAEEQRANSRQKLLYVYVGHVGNNSISLPTFSSTRSSTLERIFSCVILRDPPF